MFRNLRLAGHGNKTKQREMVPEIGNRRKNRQNRHSQPQPVVGSSRKSTPYGALLGIWRNDKGPRRTAAHEIRHTGAYWVRRAA